MRDITSRIEKLDQDAIDCELIAKLAVDEEKRAAFMTLAQEYKVMADRLRGMAARTADDQARIKYDR